jgi:hypothetical protein
VKKVVLLRIISIVTIVISLTGINYVNAQEIEVNDEYYYLRTKDTKSTLYGNPSGALILAGRPSTLFTIIVDDANSRGLQILNDWTYPAAFEVFGSGVVKANNVVLTSDVKEKDQIEELGSQIDKIKKLKAVSYKWKDKKMKSDKTNFGFLAQDLEKIYPDMVFRGDSGEMGIFYVELIPVLLNAIQEQQAEIESQNKHLIQLEAQNKQLPEIEKRLAKLEQKLK